MDVQSNCQILKTAGCEYLVHDTESSLVVVEEGAEKEGGADIVSVDSMNIKPDRHLSAGNWRESAARDTEYMLMGIVEGVEDEKGVQVSKDDVVEERMGLTSYRDNSGSDWEKGSDTQASDRLESSWNVRAKTTREMESVSLSEVQDPVTGDSLPEMDMDSEEIAEEIESGLHETQGVGDVALEETEAQSVELEMHDDHFQTSPKLLSFPRNLELFNPVYALTHQQPPPSPPHREDTYRYIRNRREQRKEDFVIARRNSMSVAKELEDVYGRGTPPVPSSAKHQGGEASEDENDERGSGVLRPVESREESPQPGVRVVRPRSNPRKRSPSHEMEMDEEVEDRSKKRKKVEVEGISDPRMLFHRGLPELEDVEGWK